MKRALTYTADRSDSLGVTELRKILQDVEVLDALPGGVFNKPVATIAPIGARQTTGQLKKLTIESWR